MVKQKTEDWPATRLYMLTISHGLLRACFKPTLEVLTSGEEEILKTPKPQNVKIEQAEITDLSERLVSMSLACRCVEGIQDKTLFL